MYVRLSCGADVQDFNIWVYGERNELVRGSGLFVSDTGVEANHHFLMSRGGEDFYFMPGSHKLEVFTHLLGDRAPCLLFSCVLDISVAEAHSIASVARMERSEIRVTHAAAMPLPHSASLHARYRPCRSFRTDPRAKPTAIG